MKKETVVLLIKNYYYKYYYNEKYDKKWKIEDYINKINKKMIRG